MIGIICKILENKSEILYLENNVDFNGNNVITIY